MSDIENNCTLVNEIVKSEKFIIHLSKATKKKIIDFYNEKDSGISLIADSMKYIKENMKYENLIKMKQWNRKIMRKMEPKQIGETELKLLTQAYKLKKEKLKRASIIPPFSFLSDFPPHLELNPFC